MEDERERSVESVVRNGSAMMALMRTGTLEYSSPALSGGQPVCGCQIDRCGHTKISSLCGYECRVRTIIASEHRRVV